MEDCNFNAKAMRRIYREKHRPEVEKHKLKIENQKKEIMQLIKKESALGNCSVITPILDDEIIKFLRKKGFEVSELVGDDYLVYWGGITEIEKGMIKTFMIIMIIFIAPFIIVIFF